MKKISLFLISIFILYGCGNNSPTTSEESPLLPNIKKYKLDEENSLSSNNQQYKLDAEGSLSPKPGKYNFVIYKDSTGDFFAPNGGRICSFKLSGGFDFFQINTKNTPLSESLLSKFRPRPRDCHLTSS